jgi:hypothetical protein
MPEPAAPHTDQGPPKTRPERAVPPMPSEATNVHAHRRGADSWLRRATMPLRKMMHRAPDHP